MGHALDASDKPIYTPTPTQTVADLQAAVDYAEKAGGLLKVTASERTSLTAGQTKPGWLISETDTKRLYLVTAESPQGIVIYADTGWIDLPLSAGWSALPADPPQYRVRNNELRFRGRIDAVNGATGNPFTITLPVGARPSRAYPQRISQTAGSLTTAVINVATDGVVTVFVPSGGLDDLALSGFVPVLLD